MPFAGRSRSTIPSPRLERPSAASGRGISTPGSIRATHRRVIAIFDVWFGALRHGYRFARLLQADNLEEPGYHLAAQALRSEPVVAYSYGRALAVAADCRVATWGRTPYPTQGWPYIRKPDRLLRGVRAVAAGAVHYLALTRDGRVVAWSNDDSDPRCAVPPGLTVRVASSGVPSL